MYHMYHIDISTVSVKTRSDSICMIWLSCSEVWAMWGHQPETLCATVFQWISLTRHRHIYQLFSWQHNGILNETSRHFPSICGNKTWYFLLDVKTFWWGVWVFPNICVATKPDSFGMIITSWQDVRTFLLQTIQKQNLIFFKRPPDIWIRLQDIFPFMFLTTRLNSLMMISESVRAMFVVTDPAI